jgi:hypothetical protein
MIKCNNASLGADFVVSPLPRVRRGGWPICIDANTHLRIPVGIAAALLTTLLLICPVARAASAGSGSVTVGAGAANLGNQEIPGIIRGTVLDSATGRPVPGVVIEVERQSDGRRWFSNPTDVAGLYLATVSLTDTDGQTFLARTMAFDYVDTVGSGLISAGQELGDAPLLRAATRSVRRPGGEI